MPTSKPDPEYVDHLVDLMQALGPVRARRMFGGHGLYLDGLMFALIADGELYLKADRDSLEQFEARGLPPFTYTRKGKTVHLCYYRAPDETQDDPDAMRHWAGMAHATARKAAGKRRKGWNENSR